jgi:hypothetical protein
MIMRRICDLCVHFIVLGIVVLSSVTAVQSASTMESVYTTDVTPSSFSVIWQTSELSEPAISIFSDPAGANDITKTFAIVSFPVHSGNPDAIGEYAAELDKDVIRDAAKALGLMKITVHGCTPDTSYYFKVHSQANGETATWPEGDPAEVVTTSENSFISGSHQLLLSLINDTGDLDASGWMVTASSTETLFPVSGFVEDGAGTNQVYLNLAHLFGTDGLNWMPSGTKEIILEIRGSESGLIEHFLSLDFSNTFSVSTIYPLTINVSEPQDSDGDGLPDDLENRVGSCTNPLDADTDDDGIPDGVEDANQNGVVDPGETDPCNGDTDGDDIQDGTELGDTTPVADPDGDGPLLATDTNVFIPDLDPTTTTDPLDADSDDDTYPDGLEDGNHNGSMDSWETDPSDPLSYPAVIIRLRKGFNLIAIHATGDLRDWLPALLMGFGCPSEGYSAFQLLTDLGSANISSIQRYSPKKGAFETASYRSDGEIVGVNFPIVLGEGYFIFMRQELLDYEF